MRLAALIAGLVAWIGAALASLCCHLPLAVIVLGLGAARSWRRRCSTVGCWSRPGIVGIVAGFVLYVRERRRCSALACRMAGSRVTLGLLVVASLVVTTAIVLDRFPEFTLDVFTHVMSGNQPHTGHKMGDMR
jgi:hypothetical protein